MTNDLKARIRMLVELLGASGMENTAFAQAVSALRRAAKHGDRAQEPSAQVLALLKKAEDLGRTLAG